MAEGRYLSDELTLHYGLVPRTNRGIFAINELPDLAERIQVGLLNVLEERDIQVRGYKISLPLDLILFASANPEDYTNRGRIITPLKDRFGSQIRTHYPLEIDTEVAIALAEAVPLEAEGVRVTVPDYMTEIVATLSHLARSSPHINQRSGVSVRFTITNHEVMVANATRRALRHGEKDVAPRISDLEALPASMMGKIEIESLEEGRDAQIAENLVKAAVLTVFKDRFTPERFRPIVTAFEEGAVIHAGEDVTSAEYVVAARAAAGAPRGRHRPHRRRRVRRVGRVRRRAAPRGPAPQQAPQQGRRRRPRHLPRQGVDARRLCRDYVAHATESSQTSVSPSADRAISAAGLGLRSRSKRPKRTSKPWPHS